MAEDTARFSANSAYLARLVISVSGTKVGYRLQVEKLSGTGFSGSDTYDLGLNVGGSSFSGSWGPYNFTQYDTLVLRNGSVTKSSGSYTALAWVQAGSSLGRAPSSGNLVISFTIADQPSKPSKPSISDVTTTGYTTSISAPASNGSSIVEYQVEAAHSTNGGTVYSNGTSRTRKITGRAEGNIQYSRWRARNGMGWGSWSDWASFYTLPVAPGSVALGQATVSSLVLTYTKGDNGNGVTEYQIQHNATASESGATTISNGTNLSRTLSGLPAGSTRYARVRAKTSAGWGAWSSWVSKATLPATPPGLKVSPSDGGTSVAVDFSPPSGITTVTKYRLEYRRGLSGAVSSFDTTATGATIGGRVPGATYQYRLSAFIGDYQTPWTDWITLIQPAPSWLPGDFIAGGLAAGLDVGYAWTGTPNNSTSTVVGKGVSGWWTSGAGSVLQRVTGGLVGKYGARAIITANTSVIATGLNADGGGAVSPGGIYAGSIHYSPSAPKNVRVMLYFLDGAGVAVGPPAVSDYIAAPAGEVVRPWVIGTAPEGAVTAIIRVENDPATPMLAGEYVDVDGAMISVGTLYPYFDGDTRDTAEFSYQWTGTPQASASTRIALPAGVVDPLADPDCPPLPLPPVPPDIDATCVDEVGTWRRYWSAIPGDEISDHLSAVPTFTLETTDAVGQVRIRVYPNPDGLAPADLDTASWASEQMVTFIPADTVFVIDGVTESAQASVAGGAWISADHLLQGTNGGPATWPELSCGQAYVISYDVPLAQPDGNVSPSVELTERF